MRMLKCECCGERFETPRKSAKLCPACRNYKTTKSVYREGTRPRDQVTDRPARIVKKDKPNKHNAKHAGIVRNTAMHQGMLCAIT